MWLVAADQVKFVLSVVVSYFIVTHVAWYAAHVKALLETFFKFQPRKVVCTVSGLNLRRKPLFVDVHTS